MCVCVWCVRAVCVCVEQLCVSLRLWLEYTVRLNPALASELNSDAEDDYYGDVSAADKNDRSVQCIQNQFALLSIILHLLLSLSISSLLCPVQHVNVFFALLPVTSCSPLSPTKPLLFLLLIDWILYI